MQTKLWQCLRLGVVESAFEESVDWSQVVSLVLVHLAGGAGLAQAV
jgi:hypothetical protein